jgi:hypothetical protein
MFTEVMQTMRSKQQLVVQERWQDRAVRAYRESGPESDAALRTHLFDAVYACTGKRLTPGTVVVDQQQRLAYGTLDGVRFCLTPNYLTIVRPCAHCGLGAFAGPPITALADLGYALSDWQPLHADCRPFEADELH